MVFFNHATRQMTAKIVYYGPGLCGKTTNLNTIYGKTSQKARGEMVSLNTETDRTLFFDLLPMDVGMVGGFKTKLQLYTVPGQVFYNSTRKLVLKGVDGIVFVVDSQTPMLDPCRESYQNLEENLRELGLNLGDIPMVFQWNKRDLRNVVPVEELEKAFNPKGMPSFQSVASEGTGVFETLRGITKLSLSHIKIHVLGDASGAVAPVAAPPAARESLPAPSVSGALTLSDLPSITDLLDMEEASAREASVSQPLPDDDDGSDLFIEAPMLPEHPGTNEDEVSFLAAGEATSSMEAMDLPSPTGWASENLAAVPAAEALPVVLPVPVVAPAPAPSPLPPPTPLRAPLEAGSVPVAPESLRPVKPVHKVDPMAAFASMKMEAKRPALKPKAADAKDAISSLLGELTMVGRSGASSVLRLEVPAELDGQDFEVVVQLRHQGQVIVEGQLHRPVPARGSTSRLSVELKRN